jgi:hypothetical protein
MWRVNFYDNAMRLICYYNTANKREAEEMARGRMRNSTKVITEVMRIDQHETSLQHRTPSEYPQVSY